MAEDPVRLQAACPQPEKILGKQIGHPRQPGEGRLGDNDIILLTGREEMVPPVVDDHADAWVVQVVAADVSEVGRRPHHRRLQFHDRDAPDRVLLYGPHRHPRAHSDDQCFLCLPIQEQGEVTQQRVSAQIKLAALRPAVVLEGAVPHRVPDDGHRCAGPLLIKLDLQTFHHLPPEVLPPLHLHILDQS